MNLDFLKENIELWSTFRELDNQEPEKQVLKLMEEVGELAEGIVKNNHGLTIDAIGDTFVVLVILSQQLGVDFNKCVEVAYNEIKHRKGKMVNGVFVKESDLK